MEVDWEKVSKYENLYRKIWFRVKRILNHEYRETLLNKAELEARKA